jgi:hypothetical protein
MIVVDDAGSTLVHSHDRDIDHVHRRPRKNMTLRHGLT